MKNKLFGRLLVGALLGVALTTLLTLIIAIFDGDGIYHSVMPELTEVMGNELNAMAVQTLCSLLYGAAWAGASLIWARDNWSTLRQTVTHLAVCSLATFPIAYLTRWMPRSAIGVLLYFGAFAGVYAVIWLAQYLTAKKRLAQMNQKIQQQKEN